MIEAFLTGSYAYGTPNDESDIDLAIRADPETLAALVIKAKPGGSEWLGASWMFGRLNLIVLDDEFDAWKAATDELIARKPVTRNEAIACIVRHMEERLRAPKE